MANLSNIARPYALAAFQCAHKEERLQTWKAFLDAASYMAEDKSIVRLLANPEILSSQLFELFAGVLSSQLDTEQKNFLHLLAQNKRLAALPEIKEAFNAYYAQLEKISHIRVVTAVEPKEDFRQKIMGALSKRIKRDVTLQYEINPSILGGAIIHIGDNVIDGSIRGKLTRLLEFSLR